MANHWVDGGTIYTGQKNSFGFVRPLRGRKQDIATILFLSLGTCMKRREVKNCYLCGQVSALQPVSFVYNDASSTVRYGFIAEDAAAVDSHLGTYDASGNLSGVDDRGMLSVIVRALQALITKVSGFALNIVAAHVTAAVGDFETVNAKQTNTDKLCVGSICVTQAQFAAVFGAGAGVSSSSDSVSSNSAPDTTPPVITINGNNPTTINVGDNYADLGASVTDNVDQNLGYKTFLNGALVSNIIIDTSAAATDNIDYVATDNSGNTATSTRTVIVESPATAEPAPTP